MKKILCALLILLSSFLLLSSCASHKNEKEKGIKIAAPPFNGYICGFEDDTTFLQLPLFVAITDNFTLSDIENIALVGDSVSLPCSQYRLSDFYNSKLDTYKFATLSFHVHLKEIGQYSVNKIIISSPKKTEITLSLGTINFDIRKNPVPDYQDKYLSMSQFFVNQTFISPLRISYINNYDEPICIKRFTYPKPICRGVKIDKYLDFDLSSKESDCKILPNDEKTFVVNFDFLDDFNREKIFYYFLPFVIFEIGQTEYIMPAQTQATVIQAPFTAEIVKTFTTNFNES